MNFPVGPAMRKAGGWHWKGGLPAGRADADATPEHKEAAHGNPYRAPPTVEAPPGAKGSRNDEF
jgi:hypothetical protein